MSGRIGGNQFRSTLGAFPQLGEVPDEPGQNVQQTATGRVACIERNRI